MVDVGNITVRYNVWTFPREGSAVVVAENPRGGVLVREVNG